MIEVLSMEDIETEKLMRTHDVDFSRPSSVVSNNNYKATRDDAEVSEADRDGCSQNDDGDAETRSETQTGVSGGEENDDEMTPENLSPVSTGTSGSQSPTSRPLAFSIDRIMAAGNDDVGGRRETATSDDVSKTGGTCRDGQRGHSRPWTQPLSEQTIPGPVTWLSRLQRDTNRLQQLISETWNQQQSVIDWRDSSTSLSNLIGRVHPLLLYSHLQSSLQAGWWLNAARNAAASSRGSGTSSRAPQPTTMMHGMLGYRQPAHTTYSTSGRVAGKPDSDGGPRLDADWSSKSRPRETPTFAASGALDLSSRSTIHHSTSVHETKTSAQMKQSASRLRMPVLDLKNSLENIVNQDVERPGKQISCPVCGKMFNAHYNLTRHMPVHTGARPFICKVRLLIYFGLQMVIQAELHHACHFIAIR